VKKKICTIILLTAIFFTTVAFADNINQLIANVVQFKVVVNGDEKQFVQPIVTIDDRTYIPLRELSETLGMEVNWDAESQTITIGAMLDDYDKDCDNWRIFDENGLYGQSGSKYGYMDNNGKIKIFAQFDYAYNFREGLAVVQVYSTNEEPVYVEVDTFPPPAGDCGYINSKGEYVFKYKGHISSFYEGLAYIDNKDGRFFINHKFEKVFKVNYWEAENFSEGFAVVQTKGGGQPDPRDRWSFIDKTGKLATEQEFEAVGSFSDGMAAVRKDGKWGVVDNNFDLVIDYQYEDDGYEPWPGVRRFSYGLAAAKKDGKWGYIDKTGKTVINFEYDKAYRFSEGLARVSKDGKMGFINTNGEVVIPFKFKNAGGFNEGLATAQADNNKWGCINAKGEYVIKPIYAEGFEFEKGLALVRLDGEETYFYINQKGEKIEPHY